MATAPDVEDVVYVAANEVRVFGSGAAGGEISVHEGVAAEDDERTNCFLVVHPEPAPSLHPRLRGRRCRRHSVGAMEVADCKVAGLEPRRDLPSGLADEVVKKEEGTYLWGGDCCCSGRAEARFVADEKVTAVSPETKGRPQVEEARQTHCGVSSNTMVV